MRKIISGALCIVLMVASTVQPAGAKTTASKGTVVGFQPAGDLGGPLTPGTEFPPTRSSTATLKRHAGSIQTNIHTTGLPPGAYTVWWVVFNDPSECTDGCDEPDLFDPDVHAAVFYATGGVVGANGVGNFQDRHGVDDDRGPVDVQDLIGTGNAIDVAAAEIHNVLKYHGPASADPAVLEEQLTTVLGSCLDGTSNSVDLGPPFGEQCFDPQAVVFPLP